jgi:hypothetical protein
MNNDDDENIQVLIRETDEGFVIATIPNKLPPARLVQLLKNALFAVETFVDKITPLH